MLCLNMMPEPLFHVMRADLLKAACFLTVLNDMRIIRIWNSGRLKKTLFQESHRINIYRVCKVDSCGNATIIHDIALLHVSTSLL